MGSIDRIAIMGTGTMGPGMGAVLARAGMTVALFDVDATQLERARATFDLATGVLERLGQSEIAGGGVRFANDLGETLDGAEFVIEAVPEDLPLKQRVLAMYEAVVGPEVVLASNTSGIPITKMAETLAHPERVVGMHWSNPPHLIPMIEVIPGELTSPATLDLTMDVVRAVGYFPCLLKKEIPGFVENRILYAIMRECLSLVDDGVIDQEALDVNVKWGIGYKLAVIPPMQLLDMAGLDIYRSVASYLNPVLSNAGDVSSTIRRLTDEGRLGIKSGGGIFDYDEAEVARLRADRANKLIGVRKALA